ncbi:ATP-binding protein [Methyloligella solikamskensis]|uniref:histidine kinase n=1 Tax=Methyloligella solikamskensis TaxID=1177756 RepID=A0ABW3J9Y9_9HYPH
MMSLVPDSTAIRTRLKRWRFPFLRRLVKLFRIPLIRRFRMSFRDWMPKGLYARALIIIIAPMVLLQSVLTFVFLERHWQMVTRRLSLSTVQSIALLVDVYQQYPQDANNEKLIDMAEKDLGLRLQVVPGGELPQARSKPFFDLLDTTLSEELESHLGLPFWIDTVGQSKYVDIRVKLDDAVMHILARRSQTYASNSQIFLFWMLGTSLVLLTVAILFLRNQIRPVVRLSEAAESFGKGRPVPSDFRPRGAREVRQAAVAFLEMRARIERHVEQRTTMLAGVSHDLRTILTRFRLELALLGESPEIDAMRQDVDEMQAMLEDYMAFAKGDAGEKTTKTDIAELLNEIRNEVEAAPHAKNMESIEVEIRNRSLVVPVKRHAFKRAVANLANNAARFATHVVIEARKTDESLTIRVDDNGPGIPEEEREQVFRPFYRLDDSRNQDSGSTGLGLAIARDITRLHGGDITLDESPMGGLRVELRIPV